MLNVSSQPATGVYIQKIFGHLLQSVKLILRWFSTTSDSTDTNEVTIFINDTIQIEMKRPLLFYGNSIGRYIWFSIDGNKSIFLGMTEEDIQPTF